MLFLHTVVQWDTCDGSHLFTYRSSAKSLPCLFKNKHLRARGMIDINMGYIAVRLRGVRAVLLTMLCVVWEDPLRLKGIWKMGKEHGAPSV